MNQTTNYCTLEERKAEGGLVVASPPYARGVPLQSGALRVRHSARDAAGMGLQLQHMRDEEEHARDGAVEKLQAAFP